MPKFVCVIITYNPIISDFIGVLNSIIANTGYVVIVDNGSRNIDEIREISSGVQVIELDQNIGIAGALNVGMEFAMDSGADYIWLSDQDTDYESDYVARMHSCINHLETSNINFAVVGPSCKEQNTNTLLPFVRFSPFTKKVIPLPGSNEVSQLIGSGMIIPVHVVDRIGMMREELFIDWVDFEWCWRATKNGYKIIGCGDVSISHRIGDVELNVFGKRVSGHTPVRHYFMIRNGIYLSLYSRDVIFFQRVEVLLKTIYWTFVYPLFVNGNKLGHLKATLKGLFHGVVGRLGA